MIEFNYYKEMKDVDQFSLMCYMVMCCAVGKKTSIFSDKLLWSFDDDYFFIDLSVFLKIILFICQ